MPFVRMMILSCQKKKKKSLSIQEEAFVLSPCLSSPIYSIRNKQHSHVQNCMQTRVLQLC